MEKHQEVVVATKEEKERERANKEESLSATWRDLNKAKEAFHKADA